MPELEALRRWSMVLQNQYPWDRSKVRLKAVGELADDDVVVLFLPRTPEVLRFVRQGQGRCGRGSSATAAVPLRSEDVASVQPMRPYPAVDVRKRFAYQAQDRPRWPWSRVRYICTNDDLIRNAAYSWSPMSAAEIS